VTIRPAAKTVAIAALCATVAAAAGIAGSSAKTTKKKSRTTNQPTQTTPSGAPAHPLLRHMFFGGPPHAEIVVLNKAGTAWITVTQDNGTVASVSGDQLTITEGTKAVPYKTVTLTIPADAKIFRNGKTAQLSDFVAGDNVHVAQSSEGTIVFGGNQKPAFPGPWGNGKGPKGMHIHPGGPGGPGAGAGIPAPGGAGPYGPYGGPPSGGGSSNGSDSGSSSSGSDNS